MGEVGLLDAGRTYELIDGEIYQMAPETYDHASRVRRIAGLFRKRIAQMGFDPDDFVQEGHPIEARSTTSPSRTWRCFAASRGGRRGPRTSAWWSR